MLKSIYIDSLFGLYSYNINLSKSENDRIRFITGPNGYGKTTILCMISSLLRWDFDYFFDTPFNSFTAYFDTFNIKIEQLNGEYEECDDNQDESEDATEKVVNISLYIGTDEKAAETFSCKRSKENRLMSMTELMVNNISHYFIRDQRLSVMKNDITENRKEIFTADFSKVESNADILITRIKEIADNIRNRLQISNLKFDKPFEKDLYERKREEIINLINRYKMFGLVDNSLEIVPFAEDNAVFLTAYMQTVASALEDENIYNFLMRLETFKGIIDKSGFSNKYFEININFGYRFVTTKGGQRVLKLSRLSSGEQHIMVMAYELLFEAKDDAIVMIDEPEISFHVAWQMDFLDNLEKILKVRKKLQFVVSTHSPQIFNLKWEMSADLYSLANNCENIYE